MQDVSLTRRELHVIITESGHTSYTVAIPHGLKQESGTGLPSSGVKGSNLKLVPTSPTVLKREP